MEQRTGRHIKHKIMRVDYMKRLKKFIVGMLQFPPIAQKMVLWALKAHNLTYRVAGMFSQCLEADGLHPKHRLIKYHDWFMQHLRQDWHVLDVGCGNGALTYDLKDRCASVFAIDMNLENIDRAKLQFSKEGIVYVHGDATQYPFEQKFDALVLSNVLEHIEHRVEFLKQLYANQSQKKSPVLLLRVPMITRDWITLYKQEMGVEWRLDSTHFIEYTLEQLQQELLQAGLALEHYDIRFGELYGVGRKRKQ